MADKETRGTLGEGEAHPMARDSYRWIFKNYTVKELMAQQEALSSCAISGNRMAEICAETLRRMMDIQPVSDRYLLGLAWYLKNAKEEK